MKRIEKTNKINLIKDNIDCTYMLNINNEYKLSTECINLNCKHLQLCRYYIRERNKTMIMNKDYEVKERICFNDLNIVNEFYNMIEKIEVEERFSKKRKMMIIKCDGKESKRFKNMNSNYNKKRLIEKLKKMNMYEVNIKKVKKRKKVNKKIDNINKYEECNVVLTI